MAALGLAPALQSSPFGEDCRTRDLAPWQRGPLSGSLVSGRHYVISLYMACPYRYKHQYIYMAIGAPLIYKQGPPCSHVIIDNLVASAPAVRPSPVRLERSRSNEMAMGCSYHAHIFIYWRTGDPPSCRGVYTPSKSNLNLEAPGAEETPRSSMSQRLYGAALQRN